jgi:hypothetical protein
MTRMSTAVAAALVSVAVLSACGGDDAGDAGQDVASLGTGAPAAEQPVDTEATDGSVAPAASTPADGSAPPVSAPTDPEEAMLAYTECMRDHGIEMEDPQPAGGEGGARGIIARAPEADDEDFQAAQAECEPLLDAVVSDFEPDPEQQAEMREQLLDYADCMREQGIDMPDPAFDEGGGGLVVGQDQDVDVDSDEFRAADEECGSGMENPVSATVPEDV